MKRLRASAAMLGACIAWALPAVAGANGLYEPFPDAASKAQAKRFVERLPPVAGRAASRLRLSDEQLERGVLIGAGGRTPTARGPASSRAIPPQRFGPSFGWPAGVAALLAILALGRFLQEQRARAR